MSVLAPISLTAALIASSVAHAQSPSGFAADRHRMPEGMGGAWATAVADMDGDGDADLVRTSVDRAEILLQQDGGRFERGASIQGLRAFVDVTVGNFTVGDQDPDLALLGFLGDVTILAGNGAGSVNPVQPQPVSPAVAVTGSRILSGDLNGDLLDDLVVLMDNVAPQLFIADGAGGFVDLTGVNLPLVPAVQQPIGVLTDLDGDLDLDLVLASNTGVAPTALLNTGNGIFVPGTNVLPNTALAATTIAAADFGGSPLPELILGNAGATHPILLSNNGGQFSNSLPAVTGIVNGLLDIAPGDLDGDGVTDVTFLESDGSVSWARNVGGGALMSQGVLLERAPRAGLQVADLEGDGDLDLWVPGSDIEDELLLGDGAGAFLPTEHESVPIGALAAQQAVIVDANFSGERDIAMLLDSGRVVTLLNDGSMRFRRDETIVPALPGATVYHTLLAANIAGGTREDLIAIGGFSLLNPSPVRVLRRTTGGYVDETGARWPGGAVRNYRGGAIVRAMVPSTGSTAALDTVVLRSATGSLHMFAPGGGVFREVPVAFPVVGLLGDADMAVADFDGDGDEDVFLVATGNAPVYLRQDPGPSFVRVSQPGLFSVTARRAIPVDFNGDGNQDVALIPPAGSTGIRLLQGNGAGGLVDVTNVVLATQPAVEVESVAGIEERGDFALVLGLPNRADVITRWRSPLSIFGPAVDLPFHGSTATVQLLAEDMDQDGDTDIVGLRRDTLPQVLSNERLHLSNRGVAQIGRQLELRMVTPRGGAFVYVLLGTQAPVTPFPPYGLLRLAPPAQTLYATFLPTGVREARATFNLPPSLLPVEAAFQIATLEPATRTIQLGNLDLSVITQH